MVDGKDILLLAGPWFGEWELSDERYPLLLLLAFVSVGMSTHVAGARETRSLLVDCSRI